MGPADATRPAVVVTPPGILKGVCIVSANLPPAYTGAGLQALTLGRQLQVLGIRVLFITRRHRGATGDGMLDDVEVSRVDYSATSWRQVVAWVRGVASLFGALMRHRSRYDVVLFFNHDGGFADSFPVLLALRMLGIPTAARMTLLDSSDPAALYRQRFGWGKVLPYRLHRQTISISTALTKSYQQVFGESPRLSYIPNGVDTLRFRPVSTGVRDTIRQRLALAPGFRYCTFVGRITHRKGIDLLLDAWKTVVRHHPDARLVLVGPERDELRSDTQDDFAHDMRQLIERHGIGSSIVWAGRTNAVELYLQASNLFVFASRREGCPNALLEAMACGLPVVSANIPGITADIIEHGVNGLITEPSAAALAEGIDTLLRDTATADRMGMAARRCIEQRFEVGATARRYSEALSSLAPALAPSRAGFSALS